MKELRESLLDDEDILVDNMDWNLTSSGKHNIKNIRISGNFQIGDTNDIKNITIKSITIDQCLNFINHILKFSKLPDINYKVFDNHLEIIDHNFNRKVSVPKHDKMNIYKLCEWVTSKVDQFDGGSFSYTCNTIMGQLRMLKKNLNDQVDIGFRGYRKPNNKYVISICRPASVKDDCTTMVYIQFCN